MQRGWEDEGKLKSAHSEQVETLFALKKCFKSALLSIHTIVIPLWEWSK